MTATAAPSGMTVAGVLRPPPITVTPDTPGPCLRDLRREVRTGGLPVLDARGVLLGVVSDVDTLDAVDATAGELMTTATTVHPDEQIGRAAELVHGGAQRLFVVRDGELVGVLARDDVLAAADRAIGEQIEHTVIGMLPDLDARRLRVTVGDGRVLLTGRVPWRRDVAACSRVATAVPGVRTVVNRLDYAWDDRY